PKPRGGLQFAVKYQPANALGGDVYDFARLDGGKLGVLVVDISGHGVNAALLSGMVKTLAAPLTAAGLPPGRGPPSLDSSAEQFSPEGMFCAGFYLVIAEAPGAFTFGGVGPPPALIVGPDGCRQLDSDAGLIGVGMIGEMNDGSGQLTPGESVLIYTDG